MLLLLNTHVASLTKRWNQEYDYVFNLASETKYDQPEMIYEEKVIEVAKAVIEEAKKHTGLKRIFDLSTAQIYAHGSKASNENGKIKPWTGIADAKLKVEELWLNSGLPIVLLRPAIVYGPGDQSGLSMSLLELFQPLYSHSADYLMLYKSLNHRSKFC
jgi:nucleoside-diphosphate-sugar epimerase